MTTLLPFQKEGVRRIYEFGGKAMLCDDQGLGKTIMALYWVFKLPKRRPAVIVTPSSVKYAWQAEAHQHFGMNVKVIDGRRPARCQRLPGDIVVINYDILKSWLPVLLKADPQIVVFDEFHYLQNPSALRTKAAFKLVENAPSVLGLSGTPFTNELIGLWTVVSLVRPDIFPSRLSYAWKFTKPRRTIWGWQFRGAKRQKELRQILLRECLIRRLKKHVAKELPPKIHKVVPFQMGPKSAKTYAHARDNFLSWLKSISPGSAMRAKRAAALTRVGYLLRLCHQLKRQWVIQWLHDFEESNPGRKIVCLTMSTEVLDDLKSHFPNSVFVDGRITGQKRIETVRRFTNDPRVIFFFGNWIAAGTGLNLQVADTFVSLDFPFTPGHMLQGPDRIHRIGQKKQVIVYHLMLLGTIEKKLLDVLNERTKIFENIMDGETSENAELGIADELIAELRKK